MCSQCNISSCTASSGTCDFSQKQLSWFNIVGIPSYLNEDNIPKLNTVTIPTAEVLTLFDTPVEVLEAPGPDQAVYPTDIILKMDFNTAAYVSANPIRVRSKHSGANYSFEAAAAFLTSTGDVLVIMQRSGTINDNIAVNSGWEIYVDSANPTTGDSDIEVYVRYDKLVF